MKAVVQRVLDASVTVNGELKGRVASGLLVYLGVAADDDETDARRLAEKIANLRLFDDTAGKMNCSLKDVTAASRQPLAADAVPRGVLTVSQFTLLGDARKGRRPSWNRAAPPEKARGLYEYFMAAIRGQGLFCASGEFQTHMHVTCTNDGPVTILLDSKE
jgi:D-tyrosyl-tRNA(Tyr) deacylase